MNYLSLEAAAFSPKAVVREKLFMIVFGFEDLEFFFRLF